MGFTGDACVRDCGFMTGRVRLSKQAIRIVNIQFTETIQIMCILAP